MAIEEFGHCMAAELSLGLDRLGPVMTEIGDEGVRKVTGYWNALPQWFKLWMIGLGTGAAAKFKEQIWKLLIGETGAAMLAGLTVGIGAGMVFEAFEHCSSQL